MRFVPLALVSAAAVCLASCSGSTSDPTATNATAPRLTGKLDEAAQGARFQACMARLGHYRNLRVWMHGGAKPGVARSGWDQLTVAERNEIFDVSGCISTGGQLGEVTVTVTEEGNGLEIGTRRVANDRDFAAESK